MQIETGYKVFLIHILGMSSPKPVAVRHRQGDPSSVGLDLLMPVKCPLSLALWSLRMLKLTKFGGHRKRMMHDMARAFSLIEHP